MLSGDHVGPVETNAYRQIRTLMSNQRYAVLSTQGNGQPYGSLVAFSANSALNRVAFVTPMSTHKFRLLSACTHVAMVVDNRNECHPEDNNCIDALTAIGTAERLSESHDIEMWRSSLIDRHPQMLEFITSVDNAFFCIDIQRYLYVSRLNETMEWLPPITTGKNT